MKYLKRLVLNDVKNITGPLLDALQFALKANKSVDYAFNLCVHYILQHLDSHRVLQVSENNQSTPGPGVGITQLLK